MYKEDLIKYLAKKHRRPQRHYHEALTEILSGIQEKLADGKEIRLMGFGTFYTRLHKGGKGINFKTRKPLEFKPVRQAAFCAGLTG